MPPINSEPEPPPPPPRASYRIIAPAEGILVFLTLVSAGMTAWLGHPIVGLYLSVWGLGVTLLLAVYRFIGYFIGLMVHMGADLRGIIIFLTNLLPGRDSQ